jgi:polyhydroxybutyrate depolymerase
MNNRIRKEGVMNARFHILVCLTIVGLLVPKGAFGQTEGEFVREFFKHDGKEREYRIYVPAAYDPIGLDEWPLVISFHGQNKTIEDDSHPWLDGMSLVADTAHFLVAYPQGLDTPQPMFPGTPGWNVHGDFGDWDDIEFSSRLIDHISADYRVDPRKVHATGFSHGGTMSFVLACRLADRIASVAAVSGVLPDRYFSGCPVDRTVSTLLFHGTADRIHPITGYLAGDYTTTPVPETPTFWAEHNNCSLDPTTTDAPDVDTTDQTTVTLIEYPECDEGAEVQFYRIEGGGHTWPGRVDQSPNWGMVNMDIDASTLIWEFFVRHPHPGPENSSLYFSTQAQIDAFPADQNEVEGYLWIDRSEDITDLSPLSAITLISSDLDISSNVALTSLEGLSSLTTVGGDLVVVDNDGLTSLSGLSTLSSVAGLRVEGNAAMESLQGLTPPETLSVLAIRNNDVLEDLDALSGISLLEGDLLIENNDVLASLEALTALGSVSRHLSIQGNAALTGIDDLALLTTVGGHLGVNENPALADLDGLSSLVSVGGKLEIGENGALANVDGLSSLTSVGRRMIVKSNSSLTNLDGLSSLSSVGGPLAVYGNGALASCSCGLFECVDGGGVVGRVMMYSNARDGDCNNNGADLVAGACGAVGTEIEDALTEVPTAYALHASYPNPFNPSTTITYDLPHPSEVVLSVFDARGRQIESLVTSHQSSGRHSSMWSPSGVPSGVYFVRLEAGGYVATKALILAK